MVSILTVISLVLPHLQYLKFFFLEIEEKPSGFKLVKINPIIPIYIQWLKGALVDELLFKMVLFWGRKV